MIIWKKHSGLFEQRLFLNIRAKKCLTVLPENLTSVFSFYIKELGVLNVNDEKIASKQLELRTLANPPKAVGFFAPRPNASYRIFCFPPAGGQASSFRVFAKEISEDFEVGCIEYAGRGMRFFLDHTIQL